MSVSRTPLRNEALRRREERADAQRTATIVGAICFIAASAVVLGITWMAGR